VRTATGLSRIFPILHWLKNYDRPTLIQDLFGAAIVSFLFIPQSLGYALQAGLPASAGLYAAMLPLLGYAVFGTSRTLAVGPFAITSLMTASVLSRFALQGSPEYASIALGLALTSGLVLIGMGLFKMGYLSNFLSYPVSSGYITAAAIVIAASQVKTILGVDAHGNDLLEIIPGLVEKFPLANRPTIFIGAGSIVFLVLARLYLARLLEWLGLSHPMAKMLSRTAPLVAAAIGGGLVYVWGLDASGVAIVGDLKGGIPPFTLPPLGVKLYGSLLLPAALISVIGFVGAVSTAQSYAAKHRDLILPNSELLGLGSANVIAAFSGGFPVTGAVSRTVVNCDAGVQTPIASIFTAVGLMIVTSLLTPLLHYLPNAVLAATIIVAAMSMADLTTLKQTWAYSKSDFSAAAATILLTLVFGVEIGVSCGVLLSIMMVLYRSSRPHMAVVGIIPGTEHFRNVERHHVLTSKHLLSLRVDGSLYFANAKFLEERVTELVVQNPAARHFVLICSAINDIDASAIESLDALNLRLKTMDVTLHLSEVKGPIMDRLRRADFAKRLTGKIFLSQFQAVSALDPEMVKQAWAQKPAKTE
jgi:sulfate permease, SulP family